MIYDTVLFKIVKNVNTGKYHDVSYDLDTSYSNPDNVRFKLKGYYESGFSSINKSKNNVNSLVACIKFNYKSAKIINYLDNISDWDGVGTPDEFLYIDRCLLSDLKFL